MERLFGICAAVLAYFSSLKWGVGAVVLCEPRAALKGAQLTRQWQMCGVYYRDLGTYGSGSTGQSRPCFMQLLLCGIGVLGGLLGFLLILSRVGDGNVGQVEGIGAHACLHGVQEIENDRHGC